MHECPCHGGGGVGEIRTVVDHTANLYEIFYCKNIVTFMETFRLAADRLAVEGGHASFCNAVYRAVGDARYGELAQRLDQLLQRTRFDVNQYEHLLLTDLRKVRGSRNGQLYEVSNGRIRFARTLNAEIAAGQGRRSALLCFIAAVAAYTPGNASDDFETGLARVVDPCIRTLGRGDNVAATSFFNTLLVLFSLEDIVAVNTRSQSNVVRDGGASTRNLSERARYHVLFLNARASQVAEMVSDFVDDLLDEDTKDALDDVTRGIRDTLSIRDSDY